MERQNSLLFFTENFRPTSSARCRTSSRRSKSCSGDSALPSKSSIQQKSQSFLSQNSCTILAWNCKDELRAPWIDLLGVQIASSVMKLKISCDSFDRGAAQNPLNRSRLKKQFAPASFPFMVSMLAIGHCVACDIELTRRASTTILNPPLGRFVINTGLAQREFKFMYTISFFRSMSIISSMNVF